jgi:hypothetical protein
MFLRAVDSNRALLGVSLLLTAACAGAGCTAVLGMPEPKLLCPDGACEDAPSKVLSDDASPHPVSEAAPPDEAAMRPDAGAVADADASADPSEAAVEAVAPAPPRCGPEGSATACAAPTVCCQTTGGDGGPHYECTAENKCAGHTIECAGPSDCALGHVCCHFDTATVCDLEYQPDGAPGHCLDGLHNGDVVCNPLEPVSSCPMGMGSCTHPLDDSGAYFACWSPPL